MNITELKKIMEYYRFKVRIQEHSIFTHPTHKELYASVPTISGKIVKQAYIK